MQMDIRANSQEYQLCMNKEQEKVERKISKVLDESEKMQNFSLFRGFPQACFKKIPHTHGLKCKVNSFTQPPKACIVSPNLF